MKKQVEKINLFVLAVALIMSVCMFSSVTLAAFSASSKVTGSISFNADFTIFTNSTPNSNGVKVSYGKGFSQSNIKGDLGISISFSKEAFTAYENVVALSSGAKSVLSNFTISAKYAWSNHPFKLSITPKQIISTSLATIQWKKTTIEAVANNSNVTTATIALSNVINDIELKNTISKSTQAFTLSINASMV